MALIPDPYSDVDPVESNGARGWLEKLFHGFMLLLLEAIVFSVSGALVFLCIARNVATMSMTPQTGWLIFGGGGLLGLGAFIVMMIGRAN